MGTVTTLMPQWVVSRGVSPFKQASAGTTVYWVGTISTDWGDARNWAASSGGTGGAGTAGIPGLTNPVILDGGASAACVLDTSRSVASLDVAAAYTLDLTLTNYTLTSAGEVDITSDGSGTLTVTDATVIVTGDADFTLGWTAANIASATKDSNEYIGLTVDVRGDGSFKNKSGESYISFKQVLMGAAGKTTTISNDDEVHTEAVSVGTGTIAFGTKSCDVWIYDNSSISFGVGHSVTGLGFEFVFAASGTYDIPALNGTTSTAFTLIGYKASGSVILDIGGVVSCGNWVVRSRSGCAVTFNSNNHVINPAGVLLDPSGAGSTIEANFGSSVVTMLTGSLISGSDTGGVLTLNLDSSTWYIRSDLTILAGDTLDAGTSLLSFHRASNSTITTNGKPLYNVLIDKDIVTGTVSPAGALTCNNLTITDGSFDQNGQTISCANLVCNSPDGDTFDGAITASGDITLGASSSITWTGSTLTTSGASTITTNGKAMPDVVHQGATEYVGGTTWPTMECATVAVTFDGGSTYVLTGYTATDWDGATFDSDDSSTWNLTNPAAMTVSDMTVEDSNASNEIDATDNCVDGTGNTNWTFA